MFLVTFLSPGIRLIQALLNTEPMRRLGAELHKVKLPGCDDYDFNTDDYWKCFARHVATTGRESNRFYLAKLLPRLCTNNIVLELKGLLEHTISLSVSLSLLLSFCPPPPNLSVPPLFFLCVSFCLFIFPFLSLTLSQTHAHPIFTFRLNR